MATQPIITPKKPSSPIRQITISPMVATTDMMALGWIIVVGLESGPIKQMLR